MKKNEAKSAITFRHYLMANPKQFRTASFEMKNTNINSISFDCLEPGQAEHAEAIKYSPKGDLIRVESGTVGAPDYIYLKNEPAYLVIHYPSGYAILDFDTWNQEKKRSKRKSLTSERAFSIAWKVIKL